MNYKKFNLNVYKAIVTLENNNIIVTISSPDRVVTEIYPR